VERVSSFISILKPDFRQVAFQLRQSNLLTQGVRIKIKYRTDDGDTRSHEHTWTPGEKAKDRPGKFSIDFGIRQGSPKYTDKVR
jgi:hypothetical protein